MGRIEQASNGQEAFDKAKQQNFDLIFMDLSMPIMNGFESCVQILNHHELIQRQKLIQGSVEKGS